MLSVTSCRAIPLQQHASLRSAFTAATATWGDGAIARGGVTVVASRLSWWKPWLAQAAGVLDDAERQRAGRMKRAQDADARVLAYALHRLVLGRMMVLDPRDVPLSRDRQGCPRVEGGDWTTSLSHADDAVAVAVGRGGPVGVDLEPASRAASMAGIAEEILHRSERIDDGLSRAGHGERLLQAWVRKEAYLKASGVGLLHPMTAFALPVGASLRLATHPLLGQRDGVVSTTLIPLLPGYVLALSRAPGAVVQAMQVAPA